MASERPCEHDGCADVGRECFLDRTRDEPDEYLCGDHAREAGYCPCCGVFWAGVDDLAFVRYNGWCDNCREGEDYGDEDDSWEDRGWF